MLMYNEYSQILGPRILYETKKNIIEEQGYVNVKLCEKRGEKYFAVSFYKNEKEIFSKKITYNENALYISYKDGKILIHNNIFDENMKKYQVSEVLMLYNIDSEFFYYGKEIDVLRCFDMNIDNSYLINPNNRVLKFKRERTVYNNEEKKDNKADKESENFINFNNVLLKQNHDLENTSDEQKESKILRIDKYLSK